MVKEILFKENVMDNTQWTKPEKITFGTSSPGLEVITLEFILKLKIMCNDWLLPKRVCKQPDMSASSQSLRFILSLRLYLNFITSRLGELKINVTFKIQMFLSGKPLRCCKNDVIIPKKYFSILLKASELL